MVSFYGGMAGFKLRVKELVPGAKVVWDVEGVPTEMGENFKDGWGGMLVRPARLTNKRSV